MSVLHLDEYKKELKGFEELEDGCKKKERPIAAFQSLGHNLDYCKHHHD